MVDGVHQAAGALAAFVVARATWVVAWHDGENTQGAVFASEAEARAKYEEFEGGALQTCKITAA